LHSATSNACLECGAEAPAGETCRDCFEALLAYENERPPAFGAVHHLTVACYSLQHPAGYARAALDSWRELIAATLDGRAAPNDLRHRLGQRFAGARRVREPGSRPPDWWPHSWTMVVRDVLGPSEPLPVVETYVERATRWARAVRADLDAVQP
jgi:hypothetical protein